MFKQVRDHQLYLVPKRPEAIAAVAAEPEVKVRLNVGSIGYDHKPDGGEVGAVVANLSAETARVEVTLPELLRLVTEEGRPFTPALLGTPRQDGSVTKCNECFSSQQVFALDFDNKASKIVSLDTVLNQVAEMDLSAFGAYCTPSHTEAVPKFRVLFCLKKPVTNERERQIIMRFLLDLFPAADQNCKDAARHFYGVKIGPVQHELLRPGNIIPVEALTLAWQAQQAEDKAHFTDKMKRFAAKYGLRLRNGRLHLHRNAAASDKCGESEGGSNINNIEAPTKSPLNAATANLEEDNPDEEGGGYRGDFFLFDCSVADFVAGNNAKRVREALPTQSTSDDRQRNRERLERWDKVGDQLMQCRLVQQLVSNADPGNPLSHGEFFHLATTFVNLRGGDRVMEAALQACEYRSEKRIGQYRQMAVSGSYFPQHCVNSICRFKSDCAFIRMPQHRSILSLKFVRGQVRQLTVPDTISIEEARAQMPLFYEAAIESGKSICVIRADCGAGKTFSMIAAMIDQVRMGKKVVYAAPTHRLLNETHAQLREIVGEEFPLFRWPDLIRHIEQSDTGLAAEIKHDWATGHYGQAAAQIWNWAHQQAKQHGYDHQQPSCLDERGCDIIDYLRAKAHEDSCTPSIWLLTHARLVNAPMRADIAFVDEDILLRNLLIVRQFKLSSLGQLISALQNLACNTANSREEREMAKTTAETLTPLFQQIWQTVKDRVAPMPSLDFPAAKLLRKAMPKTVRFCADREEAEGAESDLLEFLTSRTVAFVRPRTMEEKNGDTIVYVSRRELTKRIDKFVIASASVNPRLCEAYWGKKDLEVYSMMRIAYQGELYLHPEKSFASSSFRGNKKAEILLRVQAILAEQPDAAVICSKAVKAALSAAQQSRVVCTFGATEGLNSYQGKDLVIIGALHRPDYVYKLLAVALGKKLGLDTTLELKYRTISRNGYDFHAVAFDDELLQEIQFAMIEQELEQAVGRARLVSRDCRVDLFTNIPLPQCKLAC